MDVATDPVQVESPSPITNTTSWTSLPVEVRQMILSLVGLPISGRRYNGLGSPKVAGFATVCWEWQVFFETCTFRRLVLDPDSFGEFGTTIRRHDTRLGYIRKLWLRVRLPKYECPDCDEPEDEATQHCNNMIFTACIQSLLGTLKLWDPARHGAEGLALMLSVPSPSDTEHLFNRCEIKDGYPFHYAEDLDLAPGMVDFHRTNIADPFSRHFHRGFPPPLHSFQLHLLPSLPKTLRQLSCTQLEIPKIERGYGLEEVGSEISPHAQAYLPREMAKLARRLERFCPPWQMDTAAFLQFIIELRESPKMLESSLKRIILRCLLSSSDRSRQDFESLVIFAAKAALSLPQQEVIELWGTCLDGQESGAYIFRDSYEDGRASIVWRSSEETIVAHSRIIAKWSEVAHKHLHSTLAYKVVPLAETKAEISKSDGTCIYRHLLLKDLLFDPITQIILENEPYEWSLDKSDSLQQGDPLSSNLANPNSVGGDPLMDSLGPDTGLASLQADLVALDAGNQRLCPAASWVVQRDKIFRRNL
ncbi:Fc.00g031730.m01.CDS01 [Cosmosporella sp. VM-42]